MRQCENGAMTISERLRDTLEEQIATGVLAPGSTLDEFSLARLHGVSRTPAREALIQLAAQGVIELRPRRGAVVTRIDPTRLQQMFELMGELEALCARSAARRLDNAGRTELVHIHRESAQACERGDTQAYFQCNERFHEAVYRGSRNAFLEEQTLQLARRLRPYRRLQLRVRDRMPGSFTEHQQILDRLLAGDPDGVAVVMRAHVVVQGERFADLLATLDDLKAAPEAAAAIGSITSIPPVHPS